MNNANVTIEKINVKQATDFLSEKWEDQRPLNQKHILRLAEEMKLGKFLLSSDAIVFIKGKLGNGQHRMSAIVKSGVPCNFLVMRTDDERIFEILDCGKNRSIPDAIHGVTHAPIVGPAARLVVSYDLCVISQAGISMSRNEKPIVRSMVLDYIKENSAKLSDQAAFVCSHYQKSRILGSVIATAFLHIASRKDPDKAREYVQNIYTGEALDASLDFRNRMIKQAGTKSRLRQQYIFALLIKAYKSFCSGTRPGTLKMVDGEEFPKI